MAATFEFELVSPEKLLVSQAAEMVVVPGAEGDFGVLPRHAPFLSTVRPGVIAIYKGNAIQERIFVAGGFAEVTETRLTVLAQEAVPLAKIDRAAVEKNIADLTEDLGLAKDETAREAAAAGLAVAEAKRAALDAAAKA
jgi:F-type H+-transporting ATPase subunit epsilon